jgi:hypothetical protein
MVGKGSERRKAWVSDSTLFLPSLTSSPPMSPMFPYPIYESREEIFGFKNRALSQINTKILEEDGKAWALNKSGDLVLNTNTDLTGYFS